MTKITGTLTYFLEPNVDTDIIIPARFLKRTSLGGFHPFAFFERRYLPSTVCEPKLEARDFVFGQTDLNPDFPPNLPNSQGATFLLTWFNFGCGSSREHAVYSLSNYKVIIGSAPAGKAAFADIFRDNCRQNLIWTPVITEQDHKKLVAYVKDKIDSEKVELSLDPSSLEIKSNDDLYRASFTIPETHLQFLTRGVNDPQELAKTEIRQTISTIDQWSSTKKTLIESYPIAVG